MPNDNKQTTVPTDDITPPMPASPDTSLGGPDIVNPSPANSGSAAPSDDAASPNIVGMVPQPTKKYAGGRIIATILGLFLLIGGVGAGVFLTGQNQNIKEKADEIGYRYEEKCTKEGFPSKWCWVASDPICGTDSGHPVECISVAQGWEADGYTCNPVTEPCGGQGGGGGGGEPKCVEAIVAYDKDWNALSSTQLSSLKAGNIVRFTAPTTYTVDVGGTPKTFNFTGARFTINGSLRSEVTTKTPDGTKYYDEYTIPAGVTSFDIKAELHWGNTWIGG